MLTPERALELGLSDPDILTDVATAFCYIGDSGRALPLAERAQKLLGKFTADCLHVLGMAGRIDQAITGFWGLMEQSADFETDRMARIMGQLLAIRGDYEDALSFAIRDHEAHPTSFHPLGRLANLYGHLGHVQEAQDAWAKMKKIAPASTVKDWRESWRIYGSDEAIEALSGGYRKAGIED